MFARRVAKIARVLGNEFRALSVSEFLHFVRHALFKDETILIYGYAFQGGDLNDLGEQSGVRKGDVTDLAGARTRPGQVPWEFRCDLYDGVEDFFVYKEGDRIGHISWVYYKRHPNRILDLHDGECEIKFCLTLPEFRGKGLYPAALLTILRYVKARGCRQCFVCVKDDNTASIRGIEKAGFSRLGCARVRKAFGVQVSRRRDTRTMASTKGLA